MSATKGASRRNEESEKYLATKTRYHEDSLSRRLGDSLGRTYRETRKL